MKYQNIIYNKALRFREVGELKQALALVQEGVYHYPGDSALLALAGQILVQQGEQSQAIKLLTEALDSNSALLDARFTLGVAQYYANEFNAAIDSLVQVIEKAPDHYQSYYYRGLAYTSLNNDQEAKKDFEQALSLNAEYAEAMGALAEILFRNYHFDAAEGLLNRSLELNPELNRIRNCLARLYQISGRVEESVAVFHELVRLEPTNCHALSNLLYSLCYLDRLAPAKITEEHRKRCLQFFPPEAVSGKEHEKCGSDKFRIGYISNDFFLHSVSFFIEPVLVQHNRAKFEIFCYSNRLSADETTNRIRSLDLVWRNISSCSTKEAANRIQKDGIDILVDLSGHTAQNRLDVCALKPAPVLISWIGYPHSTGMQQFDYYISDKVCDPVGMTEHLYTEKVWRLPRIFSCYLPPLEFPAVAAYPPCKDRGFVTFGSFNNLAKVSDTTIRLWSEVLRQVPESRLLIKSASLGGATARGIMFEKFAQYGIAEERLILKVHAPTPFEHLKMYAEMDIALDTYPYNGTTTTCEALWMGVPLITLAGVSHLARVSASFLTAIGCQELVAETESRFVSIAVALASDMNRIEHYHENLRSMMACSSLMDSVGVTRELEHAYTAMLDAREQLC